MFPHLVVDIETTVVVVCAFYCHTVLLGMKSSCGFHISNTICIITTGCT